VVGVQDGKHGVDPDLRQVLQHVTRTEIDEERLAPPAHHENIAGILEEEKILNDGSEMSAHGGREYSTTSDSPYRSEGWFLCGVGRQTGTRIAHAARMVEY